MENLPIDIHSNKLLGWLISRRHCPKNWQQPAEEVRKKISDAIQDMPENEQILAILSGGQYINYFHCKQILSILHETEKDTKNIFGFYSSQRIKDWKEIISLYERENVYLAEAANFLQRFVQYEVPALRRQIAKAESTTREFERKEHDYIKQAAESRRVFERELAKWGICGHGGTNSMDLRRELLTMADAQPPAQLDNLEELGQALAYFTHFSDFIGQDTADMFPLCRLIASATGERRPLNEVTVFEWRHGKKPESVIPPAKFFIQSEQEKGEKKDDDEIDFGDYDAEEGDIDFCINGEEAATDGIQVVSIPEGSDESPTLDPANDSANNNLNNANVATGDVALPVMDHPLTRGVFLDELDQLIGFLQFRQDDELTESAASMYLSAVAAQKSQEIGAIGLEQIRTWLNVFRQMADCLGNPQQLQMLRLRTSQRFVDDIVSQLEHKRRLEYRYQQLERLAAEKQRQCAEECQKCQQLLDKIVEAAKGLQENLEADISRRYNGREVYIMGEINAVLYGS